MPNIPEGTGRTVPISQTDTGTIVSPNTPSAWIIFYDGANVAEGLYPGANGANPKGWSVTGTFTTAIVFAPLGSKRANPYTVQIQDAGGRNPGDSVPIYSGTFNVVDPTCARPSAPVFTAGANTSLIKLTGTA